MKRRRYLCSRLQIINEFMKHADCIQIEICAVCTSTRADMVEDLSVNMTDVIIQCGKTCLSANRVKLYKLQTTSKRTRIDIDRPGKTGRERIRARESAAWYNFR